MYKSLTDTENYLSVRKSNILMKKQLFKVSLCVNGRSLDLAATLLMLLSFRFGIRK